jgi:hypothetical protein
MTNPAQRLAFVQAGLKELESYLQSDILFWTLTGPSSLPRLTIGGLLLEIACLHDGIVPTSGLMQPADLDLQLDAMRLKYRAAWQKKCRAEAHSRLRLWQDALNEYRNSADPQELSYAQLVKWRVILELLMKETQLDPAEVDILAELDKMVQMYWIPGDFTWEPELQQIFPEPEYWFLYGRLK